jgi:hypothetical protein
MGDGAALPNYGNVDPITRARAGSLAAHGLMDTQIVDILLISREQLEAIKPSPEYKTKYSEVAEEVIQRQIDMDEGWDGVEEKALAHVLQALEYNRDPKYALFAAKTANNAQRKTKRDDPRLTINANSQQTNIIVLNLNKNFVDKTLNEQKDAGTLDITPRQIEEQPRKRFDLPSPTQVESVLAPVKKVGRDRVLSELEAAFEVAGVFKDDDVL